MTFREDVSVTFPFVVTKCLEYQSTEGWFCLTVAVCAMLAKARCSEQREVSPYSAMLCFIILIS